MAKSSPQNSFEQALIGHLDAYEEMMDARGMTNPEVPPESVPGRLFGALRDLYRDKQVSMLFYVFDQVGLRIFVADADGLIGMSRLDTSPAAIQALSDEWRNSLHIFRHVATRSSLWRSSLNISEIHRGRQASVIGRELSALLLPPDIVYALADTEHLIVLPSESIGSVPFGILEADGEQLIDRFPISIASDLFDLEDSIKKLGSQNRPRSPRFSRPLIIGNPFYPQREGYAFSDLPGAEAEARYIHQLLGAPAQSLYTGKQASLAKIKPHLSKADLLFFGTHGISSGENSLDESYLVLADNGGELNDALWTAREIQHSSLKADLAVLSACQSGLGVSHAAGIIGLARAFRLSGVDHVIMSLWNVNDEATRQLMERLFVELINSPALLPSEALRNAQLHLRETWPKPVDWAAFSSFGLP